MTDTADLTPNPNIPPPPGPLGEEFAAAQASQIAPAPDSQMSALAARHQQLSNGNVLHLQVPRWEDPEIIVSYKPADMAEARADARRTAQEQSDDDEAELNLNARLLIRSCVGIDAKSEDGTRQHWDGFDHRLAAELNLVNSSATRTCRKLFLADGDLLAHAAELARWSTPTIKQVDQVFAGE